MTAAGLAGKKVLVVDDDFRNIFAVTVLLERGRLEVISADSGAEGIAALEHDRDIDIVLLDIMMPAMDGYETMRRMHALPGPKHPPIIALTAKTGNGERERCLAGGASGYVSKPVENGPDFLLALSECLADGEPS
jgi:CheY-like chemotaxis protein